MRYPETCSTIIDVTKPPYCADNTGTIDCTKILCRVLDDILIREGNGLQETAKKMEAMPAVNGFAYMGFENRKYIYQGNSEYNVIFPEFTPPVKVIYFPAGTYLISDTVTYHITNLINFYHSKPFSRSARGIHFLGESMDSVTIRLADHSKGFEEGSFKPLISYIEMKKEEWRKEITNVAQMNTFEDITVDCGAGNPGAVALRFVSSNSGRIENCRFLSKGSEYAIQTAVGSEGVAENIEIDGFQYGIRSTDSAPLIWQDISMKNIKKAGVLAGGRTILQNLHCVGAPLVEFSEGYGTCFAEDCTPVPDESSECGGNTMFVRNGKDVKVYGRNTQIPFGAKNWQTTLTMPKFPKNARPPMEKWVSVNDFGADPTGEIESSAAIQKAFDSGAELVYFESGHYLIDQTIYVPATVRVVDFLFCDFFAGENIKLDSNAAVFTVAEDSEKMLSFENLYTFEQLYGHFHFIKHACKREILCKDLHTQTLGMYMNTVPGGKVWLDNCAATTGTYSRDAILHRAGKKPEYCTVIPYEFHGQWVRGRNVNPERADVELLNDASEVMIYGLKSEGPGTMLKTIHGGKSEICIMNIGIGKSGADNAIVETEDSEAGFYFLHLGGFAPDLMYENVVEEINQNEKKSIHRTQIIGADSSDTAATVIAYHTEK